MKTAHERGHIEHKHFERIVGSQLQPRPIGIIEHQFDIGALSDDVIKPFLVAVIFENAMVERARLVVGDTVKINAI